MAGIELAGEALGVVLELLPDRSPGAARRERLGAAIDLFAEDEAPAIAVPDREWLSVRDELARGQGNGMRLGVLERRGGYLARRRQLEPRRELQIGKRPYAKCDRGLRQILK